EWQRSNSEGTAVRSHRQRRQSRRRRERVLLLSRFHADPLVYEGPVQISTKRIPLRQVGGRKPPAGKERPRVRTARRGRVRRKPIFRCCDRIRQSRRRRYSDQNYGNKSWTGRSGVDPASDNLVPQYLVVGARRLSPSSARVPNAGLH